MLRTTSTPARALRIGLFGLATFATVAVLTTDAAEARRRHRHHHHSRHHVVRESYNPAFASIIVDANSGATLQATSADGLRHPASLTKVMTLYLLFERIESGKMRLDSEMRVSEHASEQDPTKLGLRPGQTINVEDAIKGIVTRSANDAAVVVAEAIGGDESDFARMMTRKARALGMTRTTYVNASGLPNDDQITTARDQSILARAIQDRFPRYYHYFSTTAFTFRGHVIRGHNHLLGSVEGVDGIKTGYTRASGFNLITSIRRGNRHLIGVVLGGRSSGSRDATMRKLLAENLDKAATRRTVAAITERSPAEANAQVAEAQAEVRTPVVQVQGAVRAVPPPRPEPVAETEPAQRAAELPPAPRRPLLASATAAFPARVPARQEPAPLTAGVIDTEPVASIPGSTEPMKPIRIKTIQVRAGGTRTASAAIPPRAELPPQPANHGTGQGILGVLPGRTVAPQTQVASAEPPTQTVQQNGAIKPVPHSGWIIQVGALESENAARERLELARDGARGLLGKADPFTEPVAKGEKTLYRARFAGLDRDQAEAACRKLKRSDISCITIRN